jgi:hypothetical protein
VSTARRPPNLIPAAQCRSPRRQKRNRPLIVLATLAAAFFLGMSAFLTLWLVEQDTSETTGSELQTVRDTLGTTLRELESTRSRYSEATADKLRVTQT